VGIGGLAITVVFIYLWALEGPGGYHLIVPADAIPPPPKPSAGLTPKPVAAGHH